MLKKFPLPMNHLVVDSVINNPKSSHPSKIPSFMVTFVVCYCSDGDG